MIALILSETDPLAAARTLVRRGAYILIPSSILFIKYFRQYGVGFNEWTGEEYWAGVTSDKNHLGLLCLVSGIFILYDLIEAYKDKFRKNRVNALVTFLMFLTTLWLLARSKSSTSLGSFILGSFLLVAFGVPFIRRRVRALGTWIVLVSVTLLTLNQAFNLLEWGVSLLGRNMTFTDRTKIWPALLNEGTNPIFGVGYDSFWLGERRQRLLRQLYATEAHNGYLEAYLDLGTIGLVLFMGLIISTFGKAKRSLLLNLEHGRLEIALLFVFILYNVTEAAYKITSYMCFAFLVGSMDTPRKLHSEIPVDTSLSPTHSSSRAAIL